MKLKITRKKAKSGKVNFTWSIKALNRRSTAIGGEGYRNRGDLLESLYKLWYPETAADIFSQIENLIAEETLS